MSVWYDGPKLSFGHPKMSREDFHKTVKEIHAKAREADQLQQVMRRNSEYSLFYFVIYILHWTFLDSDFDYCLCAACQGEGRWGRMWLLSREHHKSTIITIAETIRDILIHPEKTTVLYSYRFDSAKDLFFTPIKNELDHNEIIRMIWPDVVYGADEKPEVWTATALNVKGHPRRKEFSLTCASIYSQLTGSHYDRMVFDDAVIEENCQTSDMIEKTIKQWQMSLNTGNTKDMRWCVIGTYYAYGDLYCFIKEKQLCEVIEQPCFDVDGRPVLYTREALEAKRKQLGSAVYATQMLLDPKQGAAVAFKEEDICWWRAKTYEGLNIYTFVDPAGEVSRHRDNTVIITIGLDNSDNYYVIDMIRDKLTLSQKTNYLFEIKHKYSPITVFYEQNGATTEVPHIQDKMDEFHNHFDLVKIVQQKDKGTRIEALLPLFEQHKIWFPEGGCWHTNWEGKSEDMLHSFIVEELLSYPHLTHDDALDDLANILHPKTVNQMMRPDRESMERMIYDKLRGKGVSLEPFGGQQEEYDPFADYRTDKGNDQRGPWSDVYKDNNQDRAQSYGWN